MEVFNYVVLIFIVSYSISFGIRNTVLRIAALVMNKKLSINELGSFLDSLNITLILYLLILQPEFVNQVFK